MAFIGYLLKRCTVALMLAGACAAWAALPSASLSAAPAPAPSSPIAGDGAADLILTGGKIKTSHGWVEALAVRHGVIIAVGDAKSVESARTSTTQTLNLAGQTVLPGLHDVHVHPIFAGLSERRCRISQGSTLSQTEKQVRECVARAAAGAWITGGQWDASALGGIPNRAVLDRVAPNNPVLLEDTSGHSAWANSKALAVAGLTRGVPNPTNGIIERARSGDPTGVLRESAIDLVKQHIPGPTQAEVNAALTWSLKEMLATGLTSFTEAAVGFSAGAEKELQAYAELADAGVLKQRVRLCLTWSPDERFESLLATRNRFTRERVKLDCVKIFLDGVPTDSHTAAMLQPYEGTIPGRTDEAARKGLLLVDPAQLNAAVTRFDRMGLVVKFHAAGDAAVRAGLDAIEAARKANGFGSQMHNVGHSTFVARQDITRARAMGATFEVSPYLWGPTPINDDITAAVGPEVIKRVWPVREMIDSGALVVPGSDWSVVPSVNPWVGIETLVTREKPGGSTQSFGKAEAITLQEAFNLFTVNAARQEGASDRVGSIDTGMIADLIVVDRDPFAIPIHDVHAVQVRQTLIGGEWVYGAGTPAGVASAAKESSSGGQWLMVVKTTATDPQRETQFNEWYDKIDVPDVLEVPGYMRARRGVKTEPDHNPAQDGQYIAIYNMEGPSIDKIIIDMLMATRKMEERGRSTDLLKVVERDYYREYAPASRPDGSPAGGAHEYLFMLRFDCGADPERQSAFNRWHDDTILPEILRAKGVMQATRYELYRVLMIQPKAVPRYLTVVELRADTPEQARGRMQEALKALLAHGAAPIVEGDVHVYAKINDVARAARTQQ
jgi:predicted amidohydrolase YtcJ